MGKCLGSYGTITPSYEQVFFYLAHKNVLNPIFIYLLRSYFEL